MLISPFGPGPDSSPNNPPIFLMNIIITLAILAIVISPVVNTIRHALLYRYLLRHGTRVDATVTSISSLWGGRLRPLHTVIATGVEPSTGTKRIFTYRGSQRAGFQEGHSVIVLIDPRKPSRYAFLR